MREREEWRITEIRSLLVSESKEEIETIVLLLLLLSLLLFRHVDKTTSLKLLGYSAFSSPFYYCSPSSRVSTFELVFGNQRDQLQKCARDIHTITFLVLLRPVRFEANKNPYDENEKGRAKILTIWLLQLLLREHAL